jgi:hypothetical protein
VYKGNVTGVRCPNKECGYSENAVEAAGNAVAEAEPAVLAA